MKMYERGKRDMKKKSLRILSLNVAIVMVVAMLPLSALAEETKPQRRVGVVVYGAELTAILTEMEAGLNSIEEGNVDAKATIESLTELVTGLSTKIVDGSGISVPDVDISITDQYGNSYKLEEDKTIELFTETTEMHFAFQKELEGQVKELQAKLAELQTILENDNLLKPFAGTASETSTKFTEMLETVRSLATNVIAKLAEMTGMNGTLYRTYVLPEGKTVPVGDVTVKVERFSDTDENGNAITRDGYILYNDGLQEGGSGFNTYREFTTTVEEQGLFDHEIQFLGPENGISGQISIPDGLRNIYDLFYKTLTDLGKTIETIKKLKPNWNQETDEVVVDDVEEDVSTIKALFKWLKSWKAPELKPSSELDLNYEFTFPGLWCAESEAGFAFTDVDVAETGITGSEYLLVNRDELIDVLKFMKELGKDAFQGAIKATFGGTATYADGTVKDYDSIVNLYFELVKSEDGQLSLDYDTAFAILKTYLGVISDMNLFDRVVDTDTGDALTPIKLKYPIPAFLQATSDENGIVKFNRNSNVTLTWMLQIIPQITNALGDASFVQDNQVLNLLVKVANYAAPIVKEYGEKIINTLVYPFAQRLGLVGKKMASGNYIMFQTKAAEGYWINPLAYTMILTWENDTWLYVTVADLGIIMPYFFEGFYEFVRNTTFAGTIDKFLNQITGKDINLISRILTDELDITEKTGEILTGALTAFVGQIGFESLGLDTIFETKSDFVAGLNKYLYENGRTAQNLMIYVNQQAMRAKAVYTGYVTENWYFYNLDKSPTTTATKLIDKSTKNIAAAFVNPTKSGIVTKSGNTVKSIVSTIGYKVEETAQNIRTQVKSTIGAAIQSVVQKAFDSVKTSVTNFVKDMFSRLIHA